MKIQNITGVSIFVFLLSFSGKLNASYNVSSIPEELKKNAKVVVREFQTIFEVKSEEYAVEKIHKVLTILNDNGLDDANFVEYYDDEFSKITSIKITIYNEYGEKVRKATKNDILDISAYSGASVEDTRLKTYTPETGLMPFTIEIEFERIHTGTLYYPSWSPYTNTYNVAVQNSELKVIIASNMNFRYLEKNINNKVVKTMENGANVYTWSLKNLSALLYEPYCLPETEFIPYVLMAPSDFVIDGYQGNCDSWLNLGKWNNELLKERNDLPVETKMKILNSISDTLSDLEKTKILYNYLQSKTRYVSIQEGIGGWQPMKASIVDSKSFGDCKALSFYMKCLLETVGIKSYYTRIRAGSNAPFMISEFPSNQFNHVILCVPLENDTVWLECTNQSMPFGYVGKFTDDRDALMITEDGGKVVHTPIYSAYDNLTSRKTNIYLDNKACANIKVFSDYNGLNYDYLMYIVAADDADKKKRIYNSINIPNCKLEKFNYDVTKSRIPLVKEELEISAINYASLLGDRMIVPVNMINRINGRPKKNSHRKSDVLVRRSYLDKDTIIFTIPENYILDKLPEDQNIVSPFGNYHAEIKQQGDEIIYTRSFQMNKGVYPFSRYPEFVDFFDDISGADDIKMILKRKE